MECAGVEPEAKVTDVLRDYGRYFIGPDMADGFAQGLLALERNWRGPLATNAGVEVTLAQFQELERKATPQQKLNWRFQQALYRAYYDAYLRVRLLDESARERRAMELLPSIAAAEAALTLDPAAARAGSALRARVFELAEALFQSVHMQLSVPRYADRCGARRESRFDRPAVTNAINEERRGDPHRGATTRGAPRSRTELEQSGRAACDDLGDPNRPHPVTGAGFDIVCILPHRADGAGGRGIRRGASRTGTRRLWRKLDPTRYTDLDPTARYKVRFTQGDGPRATRLMANGKFEIHPMRKKELEVKPVEFEIPAAATSNGELVLEWQANPEESGNGRFVQVNEVWLMRMK